MGVVVNKFYYVLAFLSGVIRSKFRMKKFKTGLYVEPKGGLCNRMRVLDSALQLSRDINKPLHVIWTIQYELGCGIESLFEIPKAVVEIIAIDVNSLGWEMFVKELDVLSKSFVIYWSQPEIHEKVRTNFNFLALKKNNSILLSTWDRFYPASSIDNLNNSLYFTYAKNFVPVKTLQARIDVVVNRFSRTIGVHVRRTDNPHQSQSPTALFQQRMRDELKRYPNTTFFLATDDAKEERLFIAEFQSRILTCDKRTRDRNSLEGMQDAVVDLFCLASTERIIGTFYSSFTEVAASINNIPLEVINSCNSNV